MGPALKKKRILFVQIWKRAQKRALKITAWLALAAAIVTGVTLLSKSAKEMERRKRYPLPPLSKFGEEIHAIFKTHYARSFSDSDIRQALLLIRAKYQKKSAAELASEPLLLNELFLQLLA